MLPSPGLFLAYGDLQILMISGTDNFPRLLDHRGATAAGSGQLIGERKRIGKYISPFITSTGKKMEFNPCHAGVAPLQELEFFLAGVKL